MAEITTQSALSNEVLYGVLKSLHADIAALDEALDTVVAKLNMDEGVSDTDYAGAVIKTTVPE